MGKVKRMRCHRLTENICKDSSDKTTVIQNIQTQPYENEQLTEKAGKRPKQTPH